MAAARAFMAQRKDDLPVAVIAYNPEITVLTDFTRDGGELSAAVAKAPATAEGTRIYDALIEAARLAEEAGLRAHDCRAPLRRASAWRPGDARGDHRGAQRTRTCASSRSACSRPSTTPRRCRARRSRRAARTSRARRRSSSSRSSRRSASSSRTSTSSAIARSFRPNVKANVTAVAPGLAAGNRELHDARTRLLAAGHVRAELDRRRRSRRRG